MSQHVVQAVVDGIDEFLTDIRVTWHGGEPLACGYDHFRALLMPFSNLRNARVEQIVQTNATLIDERWADLFAEYRFNVGVSIDGGVALNRSRVTWTGAASFSATMKGVAALRAADVPFTAIAVVGRAALRDPRGFYRFSRDLGCTSLGINIEERLSPEQPPLASRALVTNFWAELFDEWKSDTSIRIREFDHALSWICAVATDDDQRMFSLPVELIPTVGVNGDVVVLSPEFLGINGAQYGTFVVGNVLTAPLRQILWSARDATYVRDFFAGRSRCSSSCEYFSSCGGGAAANKFFEHQTTNATETEFCTNSEQTVIHAVLHQLQPTIFEGGPYERSSP